MTEQRSHHRPSPQKRTAKDYAWIGVAATALATILGGGSYTVYDRNAKVDKSERMHRSTLRYNAEERAPLEFRIRILEREVAELRRYMYSPRYRAEVMAWGAPVASAPPVSPELRHSPAPVTPRSKADAYDKLMEHVSEGRVYQGTGYPH